MRRQKKQRGRRLVKPWRLVVMLVLVLAALSLPFALAGAAPAQSTPTDQGMAPDIEGRAHEAATPKAATRPGREVVVRPGDTLWEIASGVAGPDEDLRRVIYRIQEENGLESAMLRPGQVLRLPE